MLTTHLSENSIPWHLPPGDARQHFVLRGAAIDKSELEQILESSFSAEPVSNQNIDDVYFDTKDFQLFEKGYACCIRKMLGYSALCLMPVSKNGANDASRSSLFLNLPTMDVRKKYTVKEFRSSEVKTLLKSLIADELLLKQFRIRTLRQHFSVTEASRFIPLIVDSVNITSCKKSCTMTEFSLQYSEMILGVGANDNALVKRIQDHFRTQLSVTRSSENAFQRAMKMDAEIMRRVDDAHSHTVTGNSKRSGHDLFRAYLQKQFSALKRAETSAINGVNDTGVYQMRVSIRRIRVALKTFKPLLAAHEYQHWNDELKWVAKRLGSVRDLDVFTTWLEQHKSNADKVSRDHLSAYQADIDGLYGYARQGLLGSFESERYQVLMRDFSAWIEQEQCFFVNNDLTWKPTQELADTLIKRSVRRLNRKVKTITKQSPAEELHRFRVECKRVRYSLDMLNDFASNNHKGLASSLKKTQRVLGEHQDACERSNRIRLYANGQSAAKHGQDFIFFLGLLYAEQQPAIATQAQAFYKLQPLVTASIAKTLKSLKSSN